MYTYIGRNACYGKGGASPTLKTCFLRQGELYNPRKRHTTLNTYRVPGIKVQTVEQSQKPINNTWYVGISGISV